MRANEKAKLQMKSSPMIPRAQRETLKHNAPRSEAKGGPPLRGGRIASKNAHSKTPRGSRRDVSRKRNKPQPANPSMSHTTAKVARNPRGSSPRPD
ncbi:hypothetical protein LBMAG48_25470 [Phycisphaerae bacterium]|nr:hypothetical protein LBMAG48_25470 [Phycisphaerae bacterium]